MVPEHRARVCRSGWVGAWTWPSPPAAASTPRRIIRTCAPGLLPLSRPLHTEAQWAARRDCQQLLVSPVFPSPGKGGPWGPGRLHRFLDTLPVEGPRILALGGIDPSTVGDLRHPRLAGVAAIRPFWSGDPAMAVTAFREAWKA